MARLLNESGVLGSKLINLDDTKGLTSAINEAGFAKIIEAINVIQKRLKITGTTADEASRTLEGSTKAVKAAWANFLTGVGTPEQFSENLSTAITNIRENLNTIIPRLTEGLTEMVDLLAPEIPPIIEGTLPAIITGASTLMTGLAKRLPQLITAIMPSITQGIVDITKAVASVLPNLVKPVMESAKIIGDGIFELFIKPLQTDSKKIGETASLFISNLAGKIADSKILEEIGSTAGDIISGLANGFTSPEALGKFVETAPKIISGLVHGIVDFLTGDESGEGGLLGAATQIVKNIGDYFSDQRNRDNFAEGARKILTSISNGLIHILKDGVAPLMVEAGKAWITVFCGSIDYDQGAWTIVKELSKAFVRNFGEGFKKGWDVLLHPIESIDDFFYGGDIAADKGGVRIGQDLQEQYNNPETETNLGITDWASAQKVRRQFTGLDWMSDAEIVQWIESGSSQAPDEWYNSLSTSDKMRLYKERNPGVYVPGFANGTIVTKPTLAMIGEAGEPEAVVPLGHETETSRALGLGGFTFNITINAPSGNAQDISQATTQALDQSLREWQLRQQRGVGGAAWQR